MPPISNSLSYYLSYPLPDHSGANRHSYRRAEHSGADSPSGLSYRRACGAYSGAHDQCPA